MQVSADLHRRLSLKCFGAGFRSEVKMFSYAARRRILSAFLFSVLIPMFIFILFAPRPALGEPGPQPITSETSTVKQPRISVEEGSLLVNGNPVFLYGGELQYFRVRDPEFEPVETWRLWEETLDAMKEAGMNYVTTYIPWDYHELDEGVFDFSGARDLDRFLGMCRERGFYVGFRPGPYINAEWPAGFGSFGAVPDWVREKYPEILCVKRAGGTYGQPTYLHPVFLTLVERWFQRIAPILRKYVYDEPCIINLQLDNEPNFFFANRYDVDYSQTMLDFYHDWLERKYMTIDELNTVYRSRYSSFEDVPAPRLAPKYPAFGRAGKNCRHWDWHDAGDSYILDYLLELRAIWESFGFTEDEILFTTNDHHSCNPLYATHPHVGPRKNIPGLAGVDFYPKMYPFVGDLLDYPYLADFATRVFGCYNRLAGFDNFVLGPEVQGGWFLRSTHVKPEATAQVLAKSVGRGMKGVCIYVIRDGYNINNSIYDFGAAISVEGDLTERYDILARFGSAVVGPHGRELLRSVEVEDEIAQLIYWPHLYPQGGVLDNMQNLSLNEQGALFGMLVNSGYNPAVVDLHESPLDDLLQYRALFFLNPDFLDGADAAKLLAFVEAGGILVNFLWPGSRDLQWFVSPENNELSKRLFPADPLFYRAWAPAGFWPFGDEVRYDFGGRSGLMAASYYSSVWSLFLHPFCNPFLFDRLTGLTAGYYKDWEEGRAYFIGTHLASLYNRGYYYYMNREDMAAKESLLDWMMEPAGITKTVYTTGLREEAWARRVPGAETAFLFIVNNHDEGAVEVIPGDVTRLGLRLEGNYRLRELLRGVDLGTGSGYSLETGGVSVELPKYGVAVVRISPAP